MALAPSPTSPTEAPQLDMFPTAGPSIHEQTRNESAFNYYFLFLAAFGLVVVLLSWWGHRHRSKRREHLRLSGQHALARDMEGWTSTGRFMPGRYHRNQTSPISRMEDGLDTQGEAPPPYRQEGKVVNVKDLETASSTVSVPTIPLKALVKPDTGRANPPGYEEAFSSPPQVLRRAREDTAHR